MAAEKDGFRSQVLYKIQVIHSTNMFVTHYNKNAFILLDNEYSQKMNWEKSEYEAYQYLFN